MKKIMVVMLTVLLLTMAGCGNKAPWAFQSGDKQASEGLYIIYQVLSFSEVEQKLYEENGEYPPDSTTELLQMTVGGQPVSEWISARAKEKITEYFAVMQKFDALGLELNEDDLNQIEDVTDNILQESDGFYEKNGISRESLLEFYTYMMKADCILLAIYGKGGEYEVDNKEIEDYIRDTYAMADLLMMARPYDNLGSTEDEYIKEMAEEYLSRLQAGEAIEDLAYDWMLLNAATQELYDSLEKPDKRDMRVIISAENRAEVGLVVYNAIMGTEVGMSRIVEDDYAIIIVDRIDFTVETEGFEDNRYDMLRETKTADLQEKIAEWALAVEMTANQPVLKRHTPNKIEFIE